MRIETKYIILISNHHDDSAAESSNWQVQLKLKGVQKDGAFMKMQNM